MPWQKLTLWAALCAAPVAFLEILRLAMGTQFSWSQVGALWALVAGLLLAAQWTQPYPDRGTAYIWPWPSLLILGAGCGAALVYALSQPTWAAWVSVGVVYFLILSLDNLLTDGKKSFWQWAIRGLLALASGLVLVAVAQVESRFSDEEFFVALQALALGVFGFLLLAVQRWLPHWPIGSAKKALLQAGLPCPASGGVGAASAGGCTFYSKKGIRLDRRWFGPLLLALSVAGLVLTARAYQRSFYPPDAPVYEGISAETPFLCSETEPDPQTYDGNDVFRRLLPLLEVRPEPGPPEYGQLALATGDPAWADTFHKSLLSEAAQGRFTGPAFSVKSVQHDAALRAYYLTRIRAAFPTLFSDDELARLRGWFAAVNQRALTVEAVDWMYGLAFAKWPEGPYENQENGAGLLALLEAEGWADPNLSAANQGYLDRNRRGWRERFRNTDDAFIYQPEWITNAYFQSLYTGQSPGQNLRLSFEWLLLQALPDGAILHYNHTHGLPLTTIAYLGARLLDDPRYVWLAGRTLEAAEKQQGFLVAQPGIEQPVSTLGRSPTEGFCLLYGGSGLPNQLGPLAPDKIVFRDGWTEDSAYLLLNLRFTGWHRYKATNTISMVYQEGPLSADVLDGEPFKWLPVGRSVFRDKRIPRENLNGLLVERTGMSAALYALTGIGGPWAQDPPFYAEVIAFGTADSVDRSHTRLADWHGWQHDRQVYFYHQGGPIVVVDKVVGPPGRNAALAWQLGGAPSAGDTRILLRDGERPVEVVTLALNADGTRIETAAEHEDGIHTYLLRPSRSEGKLEAATLFLPGQWAGADVEFDAASQMLHVVQGHLSLTVPLSLGE